MDPTTNTDTDLKRAGQRARASTRQASREVKAWIEENERLLAAAAAAGGAASAAVVTAELYDLLSRNYAENLLPLLARRKRLATRRALRTSRERMKRSAARQLSVQLPDDEFAGRLGGVRPTGGAIPVRPDGGLERALQRTDRSDEETFTARTGSLPADVSRELTRTLTHGRRRGESNEDLADRVDLVMFVGPTERPDRPEKGITGHTAMSRAERAVHDSVQVGYMAAAAHSYLTNGFRYGEYVAILDERTTDLCRGLDGVIVDMVRTPWLIPPNHWFCRSNVLPLAEVPDGEEVYDPESLARKDRKLVESWRENRPLPFDTREAFSAGLGRRME